MSLTLTVNGEKRSFENLTASATLEQAIALMELKGDRIAVEHNGEIVQRARWAETAVSSGDRLEVVHFVGGGAREKTVVSCRLQVGTDNGEGSGRCRPLFMDASGI